ncbi:hypothetical protein J3A78_007347 [Streptomyces sp. PvR006]|nr:hypothetical protein [Streptomyces sp. PvR006]
MRGTRNPVDARRARRPSRRRRRPGTRGGRCRPCSGCWPRVPGPSRSTASPHRSQPTGTPPSRATSATGRCRTRRAASCSTRCGRCLCRCPGNPRRPGTPERPSCRGCGCRWRDRKGRHGRRIPRGPRVRQVREGRQGRRPWRVRAGRRLRPYSARPRRRRPDGLRRPLVPYGGRLRPLRYGAAARRARPETRARPRERPARRLPSSSAPVGPTVGGTLGSLRRPRPSPVRPAPRSRRPTPPRRRGPYGPRPFGGRRWSPRGPCSRRGDLLRPVPRAPWARPDPTRRRSSGPRLPPVHRRARRVPRMRPTPPHRSPRLPVGPRTSRVPHPPAGPGLPAWHPPPRCSAVLPCAARGAHRAPTGTRRRRRHR